MFHVKVIQYITVTCDRCGKGQYGYFEEIEDAVEAAKVEGFLVSNWLLDGCARQTMFCKECADVLTREANVAQKP